MNLRSFYGAMLYFRPNLSKLYCPSHNMSNSLQVTEVHFKIIERYAGLKTPSPLAILESKSTHTTTPIVIKREYPANLIAINIYSITKTCPCNIQRFLKL